MDNTQNELENEVIMQELAENLKENEAETTPLTNTEKVFKKEVSKQAPKTTKKSAKKTTKKAPKESEVETEIYVAKDPTPARHVLKVKKLSPDAKLPTKAYHMDEGWDLYANEDVQVKNGPYPVMAVSTGLSFDFPEGIWGQIESRSGLASKGVFTIGGIIDNGYKGEVKVMLTNQGITPRVNFKKGDKIAQLVLRHHISSTLEEVTDVGDSVRGDKGFGSSGK